MGMLLTSVTLPMLQVVHEEAISQIVPRNHLEAVAEWETHRSMKRYTAHNLQSKTAMKVPGRVNHSSVLSDAVMSAMHTCLTWLAAYLIPPEAENDLAG